jgi:tripeptide aminopeptidase
MTAPFTSPLAEELAPDLLERFLRYVQIDTQARRDRERCPSSPGQLELGRMLVAELREVGCDDASMDDNGYVFATVASSGPAAPVIGLLAHLDTSPDASGADVRPLVHRAYAGGVIELPSDGTRLDPASVPALAGCIGHDIVTTSGDTLLGADDKAGIAAIMAAVAHLGAHPELPRPTLRIGFTPDEEIGLGPRLFDIERFGATCAYTVDGSTLGELQDESFTAAEAMIDIHGVDVHPGMAKDVLVSALRLAARIVAALPPDLSPERTGGREGFVHPYSLTGTAAHAQIRAIVRDFEEDKLAAHLDLLERTARDVVATEPRASLDIAVTRQYRNMRDYLDSVPDVVQAAAEAIQAEGITVIREPIRGGTDGSQLSEMGLPTPNIFNGGHEYHSPREWVSVQDMAASAATLVRLAGIWSRRAVAVGSGA